MTAPTPTRVVRLLAAIGLLAQVVLGAASGQEAVDIDRDVVPAVVQIAVRIVESGGGIAPAEQLVPRGSGTLVAADGLVLTSAHVLEVSDLVADAAARQASYQQQGIDRTVRVVPDEYILSFPILPDEPPIPLYTAAAEAVDAELLDLAVLRVTGGPKNQPVGTPELRFLPLGDSNLLGRGAEITVIGYPAIAQGAISDGGEINGFETAPGISGRAWIVTDATVSGGSSGGAAVDGAGRLIGVITLASELDCRPGDTNDDGVVDELDIGCVPVGSALARLRPINLALPLLAEAGLTPPAEPETPIPAPTETPLPTETPVSPSPEPTSAPEPTSTPAPTTPTPTPEPAPTSTPARPTPTPLPANTVPSPLPMFRGNLARTGQVPGPGPLGDRVLLWSFATADWVHASPVVADQMVYVGSRDGNVYALDAFSGAEVWRFAMGGGTQSTAAVVDGVVYVGSGDGHVYALDAASGTELWRVQTGSAIVSSPAVADWVYVANWDGFVYAFEPGTGVERWRFDTNASGGGAQSSIEASPAVVGDLVYIGNYAGNVYALDAVTGEEVWRVQVGSGVKATMAVAAGIAYVIEFDANWQGEMHALDAASGVELWLAPVGNFAGAAPAVAGGMVYIGDPAGYVVALDAATGTEQWRVNTEFSVQSAPTVADGIVYVGSGIVDSSGTLHAIAAASGEERWQFPVASGVATSPAINGGIVYFGSYDGNVYAVVGSENG